LFERAKKKATDSALIRRLSRTSAARRQARRRANHRNGKRHYRFWLSDRAVEGLIMKFILESKLTERDALDHRKIEAAIAALVEEEGLRWLP
jgi:hypothetical protein